MKSASNKFKNILVKLYVIILRYPQAEILVM